VAIEGAMQQAAQAGRQAILVGIEEGVD